VTIAIESIQKYLASKSIPVSVGKDPVSGRRFLDFKHNGNATSRALFEITPNMKIYGCVIAPADGPEEMAIDSELVAYQWFDPPIQCTENTRIVQDGDVWKAVEVDE